MPQRTAGLAPGKPLERGGQPLQRKKRLEPGTKPLARQAELRCAVKATTEPKSPRKPKKRPENYIPKGRGCKIVLGRSEDWCEVRRTGVCLDGRGHSTHHRLDQSLDNSGWRPSNLLRTCGDGSRGCHGWITENPKQAHDEGRWALESHEKPELTPVLVASPLWPEGRRWVLLNDKGGLDEAEAPEVAA